MTVPEGTSLVALARRAPRFYVFMLSLLLPAAVLGALPVARLQYATQTFGGPTGVGILAVSMGLTGAFIGIPTGILVDRFNARSLVLWTGLLVGLSNLVLGLWLSYGDVPRSVLMVFAILESLLLTMNYPPLVKVQAALVPSDSRGASEIVNIVRLGLGGLLGGWAAAVVARPALTVLVCAGVFAVCSALAWVVAAPAKLDAPAAQGQASPSADLGALFDDLRALPQLRWAVLSDLVMRLVMPTQLVALFLAGVGLPAYSSTLISAGAAGTFSANIPLMLFGMVANPQHALRASYGVYLAFVLASLALMQLHVVPAQVGLMCLLVFVVSAAEMYFESYIVAVIQQRVPDRTRGRLTGVLTTFRNLLIAAGAALSTYVHATFDITAVVALLAILAVVALVALRGFAPVGDTL